MKEKRLILCCDISRRAVIDAPFISTENGKTYVFSLFVAYPMLRTLTRRQQL